MLKIHAKSDENDLLVEHLLAGTFVGGWSRCWLLVRGTLSGRKWTSNNAHGVLYLVLAT